MLQEEQEEQGRKVEWPPNLGSQEHLSGDAVPEGGDEVNNISDDQVPPPVPPRPANYPQEASAQDRADSRTQDLGTQDPHHTMSSLAEVRTMQETKYHLQQQQAFHSSEQHLIQGPSAPSILPQQSLQYQMSPSRSTSSSSSSMPNARDLILPIQMSKIPSGQFPQHPRDTSFSSPPLLSSGAPIQTNGSTQPPENLGIFRQQPQVPSQEVPILNTQVPYKDIPNQRAQVPHQEIPVQRTQAPLHQEDPLQYTQVQSSPARVPDQNPPVSTQDDQNPQANVPYQNPPAAPSPATQGVSPQQQHPAHYQGVPTPFQATPPQHANVHFANNSVSSALPSVAAPNTTIWPPPQQINLDPEQNLTTKYPSGLKIREEAPLRQMPLQVHPSQPAFKITQPMRMRGDAKWPPKAGVQDEPQVTVREFIKPKKQNKDYSGFFAQHALPSNYTSYRPPPGTQHIGVEGSNEGSDEGSMGVTNM